VRLKASLFWSSLKKPEEEYQQTVHDHAREGWRLVQIFAPGTGAYGSASYYELVLERPVRGVAK
jgi:hypothetical protein